jgi:hypothetical protein
MRFTASVFRNSVLQASTTSSRLWTWWCHQRCGTVRTGMLVPAQQALPTTIWLSVQALPMIDVHCRTCHGDSMPGSCCCAAVVPHTPQRSIPASYHFDTVSESLHGVCCVHPARSARLHAGWTSTSRLRPSTSSAITHPPLSCCAGDAVRTACESFNDNLLLLGCRGGVVGSLHVLHLVTA